MMRVEAIYHEGRLEFISPVKLRQGRIHLVVQVPDDALLNKKSSRIKPQAHYELPPEAIAIASAMEEKLERVRSASLATDKALPKLSQEKLERLEASGLRDEIRSLR